MKLYNTQDLLDTIGQIGLEQYKDDLWRNNVIATGNLWSNVKYKLKIVDDGRLQLYLTDLEDYYIKIEEGQKPGDNTLDSIFIKKIRKWIDDKDIQPYAIGRSAPSKDTAAYFIAKKIVEKGTVAQPFIERITTDILANYTDDITQAVKKDIIAYYEFEKSKRQKKK